MPSALAMNVDQKDAPSTRFQKSRTATHITVPSKVAQKHETGIQDSARSAIPTMKAGSEMQQQQRLSAA